jgi:hypothetical protein
LPKRKKPNYKEAVIDGAIAAAWTGLISFSAILGALGLGAVKTDLTGAILTAVLAGAITFFGRLAVA